MVIRLKLTEWTISDKNCRNSSRSSSWSDRTISLEKELMFRLPKERFLPEVSVDISNVVGLGIAIERKREYSLDFWRPVWQSRRRFIRLVLFVEERLDRSPADLPFSFAAWFGEVGLALGGDIELDWLFWVYRRFFVVFLPLFENILGKNLKINF